MSFIVLSNVEKSFGKTKVLRGLNLNIESKELVAIRGASGSGKSTLLYLLGGLDHPTSGKVIVEGKNLTTMDDEELALFRNQYVGFVFQFHFLLTLGVTHCLTKFPFEISGGEQQRINIIRALSLRPKILLCDEPTGNLDSKNSEKVASLLKSLAAEFGATLLVVTHDDKVASFFPRKIVIEDGQIIG
jgi:lipoprotein-releasing system ATP-binding protein